MTDRMFYPLQGAGSIHVDGFTSTDHGRVVVLTVRDRAGQRTAIHVDHGDAVALAAAIKDSAGF